MGVCKGFGAAVCRGGFILDFGSKALAEGLREGGLSLLPPPFAAPLLVNTEEVRSRFP